MPTILTAADIWPVDTGAISVTIPGLYPLPYQVKATPSWLTDVGVSGKTSLQYTLDFATPAPPDAFVDVIVVSE